jgi:hypothetical protein
MSRVVVRLVAFAIGGVLVASSALLAYAGARGPAAVTGGWAALLLIGLVVERWRYKRLSPTRPGPEWRKTDERFVDPETGKLVTVYFHPASGERRYITSQQRPDAQPSRRRPSGS